MRVVDLNDLSRHHPGGVVLERCAGAHPRLRTVEAVEKEYDRDKYAPALAFVHANEGVTPWEVRMFELEGHPPEADWCFSIGDELWLAPLADVQRRFDEIILNQIKAHAAGCRSVVELGCGYGYNLWRVSQALPGRQLLGGDIAESAVELAKQFFDGDAGPRVGKFDYCSDAYSPLDEATPPVLLFTCHSIEQLPRAGHVLDTLARYAPKIAGVLHFEPVFEIHEDSRIGQLRRAYAEAVDYNRDLLGLLRERPEIEVRSVEPNIMGTNPLNPTTIIHWTFRPGV